MGDNLGKNVPMDEIERASVTKAISAVLEGGIKGEVMIKALLSVKAKAEFSPNEIEKLKARDKRQPIPPPAPVPTKPALKIIPAVSVKKKKG